MNFKIFLILSITIAAALAEKKSYDGYKVYKVTPKSDDEVKIATNIQESVYGEVWEDLFVKNHGGRVMVQPGYQDMFMAKMKKANIEVSEVIGDVQSAINNQLNPSRAQRSVSLLSHSWDVYHNLDEIYQWLDELAVEYPSIVSTVVMGRSVEYREIKGIVINYNRNQPTENRAQVAILEGALHSREWITPATITWIIKEFLTSNDEAVRNLAEHFEWHIFPVVNPDGYVYTFTQNRLWRKNRSAASIQTCATVDGDDISIGVDLNRNFGYQWMTIGASNDSCTQTYAGRGPFSEPESLALRNYVFNIRRTRDIMYYFAFHSYSQLIIVPYSHLLGTNSSELPSNFNDMYEIGVRGAEALRERHGTVYRVGISADVMYPMSGTSYDWVKYDADAQLAYLIEMRDLGDYGFLLPAEQIIPNAEEIMDALLAMDQKAQELGYYQSSASSVLYSMTLVLVGLLLAIA